jgi:hypothetical protein
MATRKSGEPAGAGAVRASRSVKSRPDRIGMPIARKYPGLIVLAENMALTGAEPPAPSTVMLVLH